jgi:hypothetical protein
MIKICFGTILLLFLNASRRSAQSGPPFQKDDPTPVDLVYRRLQETVLVLLPHGRKPVLGDPGPGQVSILPWGENRGRLHPSLCRECRWTTDTGKEIFSKFLASVACV